MTHHSLALALSIAFSACFHLSGCDSASNLSAQEYIQRAKDAESSKDLKRAVIEYKNAIQKEANNAQARLLLGQLYVDMEEGPEAEKELIKAMELGVSKDSILIPLGKALLMQGQFKRVLDEINFTTSASSENKAAIMQLHGDAQLGLGKLDEGCQLYEQSAQINPKHVPAYWGLANCSLARANPAKARELIGTALKIDSANAESWIVLGDFERSSNPAAALDAYSNALRHEPKKRSALFKRGQLYVITGKTAEAKADLDLLKKHDPTYFGTPFLDGLLLYTDGKIDLAMEAVQQSLKLNSSHLPSYLLFALIQYDKKSYEQAAKILSRYVERVPGHLAARKLLAAAYLKLNQPEQTLNLLKPYISSGKVDAQILALAGEARMREDDPSSATDLFQKAAELVPTSSAFRTRLAMSRLAAGEEAAAIKELEAASAKDGKDFRADLALVYHFLAEKEFDKALAAIAALEKKLPDSPGTFNVKGMALAGKGDFIQARKNFERALSLKPDLISAAIRLAALDIQEKNLPAARNRYQAILDKDRNNIPAMIGLAELAMMEKKENEHLTWLERASKANPSAFTPRLYMANYYLGKNQPRKALAVANEMITAKPDSPEALALLGRVQLAAGEKQNALSTYTKLANTLPKSAEAQYELAKAHAAMGNEKAVRATLSKALELKPDYIDALTTLSKLETRTGNPAEGTRLAREIQNRTPQSHIGFDLEGDALMAQKRYDEAATLYEKALAKGKDSKLIIKRHHALLRSGDSKKADSMILNWLAQAPQDQISRAYLAESYQQRQLNQQAIAQYQILFKAKPDNPMVINNLAILYQKEKDPRALALAEKAYQLNPEQATYADTLGWILVEQGQVPKGLEFLEKAAKLEPKNPEIRIHLAHALVQAGQTARARKEIAIARAMKPNPELEQLAQQLLQRMP